MVDPRRACEHAISTINGQCTCLGNSTTLRSQADDKALLAALKEKYAKVKSQEAYQQDWRDISQQPGEKFDHYFQRLEIAYDNAYRDPEFREPKVKSRLLVEKFRDSIRDTRARESILDKGILDDEGKLKDSLVIIGMAKRATEVGDLLKSSHAVGLVNHPNHDQLGSMITEAVDKAVVAAMQRHAPQVPRQSQRGREPTGITKKHGVVTIAIQQIILEVGDHARLAKI